MNCLTCHTPNEPDARFCKNCGAALSTDAAKPAAQPWRLVAIIGGAVLVIALVALAIYWLNGPTSDDDFTIGREGGTVNLADGTQVILPPEGLSDPVELRAKALAADEFLAGNPAGEAELATAAAQLPAQLELQSAVYRFEVEGSMPTTALMYLPVVAADEAHTLDIYAWDGTAWGWLPSRVEPKANRLVAELVALPPAVAVMKHTPNSPSLGTTSGAGQTLPAEAAGTVTELQLDGFSLEPDGSISGELTTSTVDPNTVLIPRLRNWRDDGTLTASVGDILTDPARRQRQLDAVVGLALAGGYPAVQLDYRLSSAQTEIYNDFIAELAETLHAQNRVLFVRVESPVQISASGWDTGPYDWAALAPLVDRLQVPLSADPTAPNEALLTWAVGQVERSKLQPIVSARSLDLSTGQPVPVSMAQVLAQLGPLHASPEDTPIVVGDTVTFSLAGLAGGVVEIDPASNLLHFVGPNATEKSQDFYLQTEASLDLWLQRMADYNLAGIVFEGLLDQTPGPRTWELLRAYRDSEPPQAANEPVWVWTVTAADAPTETLVAESLSFETVDYTWTAPNVAGAYQVAVALAAGGQAQAVPVADISVQVEVAPATATPTTAAPLAASTRDTLDTPTPATPKATATRTPTPSATPAPVATAPPRNYQLAYTVWDGSFHNLYIADTRTNTTQLIFSRAAGPSWSPDKKRLFFAGEQGVDQQIRENRVACSFGTISEGIVAVDLPSPLRDICQVQADTWTCERKQIDIGLGPSDVCSANNIFVYQNLDWKVGSARWTRTSPSGDSVAFDGKPGGVYRTYFRAVDPISQQFHFEIPGEQASWSPDGERLVYRSGRDNKAGLWISNRDDSNATRITENGTDAFPTWSPDGRTIAFSREVNGNVDIYVVNADGSNLRQLTNAPNTDTLPVYTPDGGIIFRSARTDKWGIWQMRGDGGAQEEIIPNAGVGPDWAKSRMDVK